MEKLEFIHTDGRDYFFAHHGDEVHFFEVNQTKELSLDKFMNATLHDDTFWKSGDRFEVGNPVEYYFNANSEVVAVVDASGLTILNEPLWQERRSFYETK